MRYWQPDKHQVYLRLAKHFIQQRVCVFQQYHRACDWSRTVQNIYIRAKSPLCLLYTIRHPYGRISTGSVASRVPTSSRIFVSSSYTLLPPHTWANSHFLTIRHPFGRIGSVTSSDILLSWVRVYSCRLCTSSNQPLFFK